MQGAASWSCCRWEGVAASRRSGHGRVSGSRGSAAALPARLPSALPRHPTPPLALPLLPPNVQAAKVPLNEYEFPTSKLSNVQSQLEKLVEKNYYLHQSAKEAFRCGGRRGIGWGWGRGGRGVC